jgi:hypothetical protein
MSRSLQGHTPSYPVVSEILQEVFHRHKAEESATFCWTPGHIIQLWNGTALATAKELALLGNLTSNCALGIDVRVILFCAVTSSWKDELVQAVRKRLRVVKLSLYMWQFSHRSIRTEEVIVVRLRSGLRCTNKQ